MRLANRAGRALLLSRDMTRGVDLESASAGRFGPDPMLALANWDALRGFGAEPGLACVQEKAPEKAIARSCARHRAPESPRLCSWSR